MASVCLVKAMVFPVVMYGCESWTVKKSECKELMLLNCGVGEGGMVWGGRREEGSGWGTHVYLYLIHFDIWQN